MTAQSPPIAALITHEVENFDAWSAKFAEHQAPRAAAGILGHHVNRGADNPNLLAVYFPATDATKLKDFFVSDGLRAAMSGAGVKGTPDIKLLQPKSIDLDLTSARAGLIVSHGVTDYGRWRAAYDDFDAKRKELGITGHAVNVLVDDKNRVIVYHQAESIDQLKKFMASDDLKARMKDAGVTGPPDVSFWNAGPGTNY